MKKNWKTIVVLVVMALLVAALIVVVKRKLVPPEEKMTLERIRQYKILRQEQQLIVEILQFKYDAAVLQAKFQPAPQRAQQGPARQKVNVPELGIEGEFIPLNELPPEM